MHFTFPAAESRARKLFVTLSLLTFFLFLAWLDSPFRLSTYPLLPRTALSDEACVGVFSIGRYEPWLFRRDYFLGDITNFDYYKPLTVAVLRLGREWGGDYLLPFYWLGWVITFVQLWGFFLLGRLLLGSNCSGIFLALGSLASAYISGMGSWSPSGLVARGIFNAILPFLLAGAWKWRKNRRTWPLVLGLLGLILYVDPLASTIWAPALILCYLSGGLHEWRNKLKWLLISSLLFVVFASGFTRIYTGGKHFATPLTAEEYDRYIQYRVLRHPAYLLSTYHSALGTLFGNLKKAPNELLGMGRSWLLMNSLRKGFLPLILLAGLFLMPSVREKETREAALWVGLLGVGILLGSVAIPIIVQWIEERIRIIPFVFEMVRGIGFLYPLILIIGLICVAVLAKWVSQHLAGFGRKRLSLPGQFVFVIAWLVWFPPRALSNLDTEAPTSELRQGEELKRALSFIRTETPAGAVFVGYCGSRYFPWPPDDLGLFIRLYGERPVAFCWKDGASFLIRNPRGYLAWTDKYKSARQTLSKPWKERNDVHGFCSLARSWGAEFWLTSNEVVEGPEGPEVPPQFIRYRNGSYMVVDLTQWNSEKNGFRKRASLGTL